MTSDEEEKAVQVQDAKDEKRTRWAIRERWAYIVLVVIVLILFVGGGAFVINYVNANNHAWCDIIHASLPSVAPDKPAPSAPAKTVKYYHDYQIVVTLGHRFGCL